MVIIAKLGIQRTSQNFYNLLTFPLHPSLPVAMAIEFSAAMKAVVRLATSGQVDVTTIQREAGDICVLIEWPHRTPRIPAIRLCILEDTVQAYNQCDAVDRANADMRLFKYLQCQLKAQDELLETTIPRDTPYVEWTILYQQVFDCAADQPPPLIVKVDTSRESSQR